MQMPVMTRPSLILWKEAGVSGVGILSSQVCCQEVKMNMMSLVDFGVLEPVSEIGNFTLSCRKADGFYLSKSRHQ